VFYYLKVFNILCTNLLITRTEKNSHLAYDGCGLEFGKKLLAIPNTQ